MASFIPNITDVFPEPVLSKLDINRVERNLKLRDASYIQGAKRFKSVYDSLFNSPLLRNSSEKKRADYLNQISGFLKQASSLDFSLPENQYSAEQLFTPLYEDPELVKDFAYTRQAQNQMGIASQYLNSSNPSERKKYWEEGMKALNYQIEEFQNADTKKALNMSAPRYVEAVDLDDAASKIFKDMNISVSQDNISGGYIWTMKNGDAAVPISQAMVMNLVSTDPNVKAMFDTRAYVQRKDYIKQNAPIYGSEEIAEQKYLQTVFTEKANELTRIYNQEENNFKLIDLQIKKFENLRAQKGVIDGSEDDLAYKSLLTKKSFMEQSLKMMKERLIDPKKLDYSNVPSLRNIAEQIISDALQIEQVDKTAKFIAFKNSSVTAKVDPLYQLRLNNELVTQRSKTLEYIRSANAAALEKLRHKNKMDQLAARGTKNNVKNTAEDGHKSGKDGSGSTNDSNTNNDKKGSAQEEAEKELEGE